MKCSGKTESGTFFWIGNLFWNLDAYCVIFYSTKIVFFSSWRKKKQNEIFEIVPEVARRISRQQTSSGARTSVHCWHPLWLWRSKLNHKCRSFKIFDICNLHFWEYDLWVWLICLSSLDEVVIGSKAVLFAVQWKMIALGQF